MGTEISHLHQMMVVYALVRQFLQLSTEGDDVYTKVEKNLPPHESPGWTIALMDRASRFLWELDCGKRDQGLFQQAVERLAQVVGRTNELSLFTDGERLYGTVFRRRTNTYAKSKGGLRRILRVYWVIHHFARQHFTTKEIPAVQLGVLERRSSVKELCLGSS